MRLLVPVMEALAREVAEAHGREPASAEAVMAVVSQYMALGGDVERPEEAPEEIRPFIGAAIAMAEAAARQQQQAAAGLGPAVPAPNLGNVPGASLGAAAAADARSKQGGLVEGRDYEHITPVPGFVLKTQDATANKVFVNVCSHENIAVFGDWKNGVPDEVTRAMDDAGETGTPVRVPLSLDGPRMDSDKTGAVCTVWDCCFNSDVVKQAMGPDQRRVKLFLCQVAINAIAQRTNGETALDERFKFPKMAYKGNPEDHPHIVRKDPKKVVHEVREVFDESDVVTPIGGSGKRKKAASAESANAVPRVGVTLSPGAETVTADVRWSAAAPTDAAATAGDATAMPTVRVSAGMCEVHRPGWPAYTLPLGVSVSGDHAHATWDGRSVLTVTLAVVPYASALPSLRAHAAVRSFGGLHLRSDALSLAV